ncbi:T-cell receptor beta-2 chain C region isoform X2 [Sphaeramia orbicularis]|uniref:T-cell receptor beta-2 chain C region isoform X2 n=1 Tax=Sphaeramia orbicularis TaxID=375764 RepID=UPI003F51A587
MISILINLTFFIFWAAGVESQTVLITQWPRSIVTHKNSPVEMHCYQNNTDYTYVYWYKQSGKHIQLVVMLVGDIPNYEEEFKSGFKAVKSGKQWSVNITSAQEKDGAVYLCAAMLCSGSYPAYFGEGTKLTVVEREVKEPTVKLLKPSHNECRNKKDPNKRKKTLVCLATDFYPDHVNVSWEVNGNPVKEEVATDNYAQKKGDFYSITSRLRVPYKDWHNPDNLFKCTVNFFNGTVWNHHSRYTHGVKGNSTEGNAMTREKYLKISNAAKLSYGVFIIKSCLYGVFVAFMVWKLQGSAEKQNN